MGAMTNHAGPMIQASSLANIISIADSPPPRPSPRRHGGRPLELYIARVPGSRDIFLTTLKPRDKVVTAQDVESCLYYLHLETENDDLFRHEDDYFGGSVNEDENGDHGMPATSPLSRDEPISPTSMDRAPQLPPRVNSDVEASLNELHLGPTLPPRPNHAEPVSTIRRKPVHANVDGLLAEASTSAPNLPRRPLRMPIAMSRAADVAPILPQRPSGPRPLSDRRPSENNVTPNSSMANDFPQPQSSLHKLPEIPRRPVSIVSHTPPAPTHQVPYPVTPTDAAGKENVDFQRWPARAEDLAPAVPPHRNSIHGQGFDDMPWLSNTEGPAHHDSARPRLPPRPADLSPRSTHSSHGRSNSVVSTIPAGFPGHTPSIHAGFKVMLIRRNPSDGTQANVGKISVPATETASRTQSKALIQIFTPSYQKFRAADPVTTASLVRCISEDDDCTFSTDLRLATRRRSIKSPTSPYFGDVPVNQLISVTPSQPYSFLSPWNRVCEFSTGVGGRSLKCRHMLARGNVPDEDPNSMNVCTMSELRFNTPSTQIWAKRGEAKRADKRRPISLLPPNKSMAALHRKSVPFNNFAHSRNNSHPSSLPTDRYSHESAGVEASHDFFSSTVHGDASVSDDFDRDGDVEPMDLALGQERAGGGFKGNKAKLGKLVIEPEGLEMLDLLVAANMGIWWSIR